MGTNRVNKPEHLIVAEDWTPYAVAWIKNQMEEAIAERGRASLALCGGSTPIATYSALARRLDWSSIDLFYGDERCVEPEHEDSTHRLVRAVLLDRIPGTLPAIYRMEGEDPDFDAAARRYATLLPEHLDLAIQGLGADGHTASLFPGHPALKETQRRVVHVGDCPKPPADRLSVTLPVLAAARKTAVLASGGEKAAAVARALQHELDLEACPAQVLRGGAWFLDPPAAADLKSEKQA